jgi:hypothetical protein
LTLTSIACTSFTGVANTMGIFHSQGKIERAPSPETCIQWEMKMGLYKLSRPKTAADDWIWLFDHFVSKGGHKCLAVMGVRMTILLERGDLTLCCKDLEPLGIVPMKKSNGELMQAELESILAANYGTPPLAIIKDQGSDVRCGGRAFSEAHPGVIDIDDIPHRIARLYEHLLSKDESWKNFTIVCANFKKKVQLTEYAVLAPPNQRTKARYHNIDVLVDWATKQLLSFEELSSAMKAKLRWLMEYRNELKYWQHLVEIGRISRDFVRTEGLWLDCYELLEDRLLKINMDERAKKFRCDLVDVFKEMGNKIPSGKKIIGSTESIESLFGKYKGVVARGPQPMGRLILSMASRVGEHPTELLVQSAFEEIKERDVSEWLQQAFNSSTPKQFKTFNGRNMESSILVA